MRKLWIMMLTMAMMMMSLTSIASAQENAIQSKLAISIDGKSLQTAKPSYLINNSLFVPYRDIAEGIGADVVWNSQNKTVTVKKNSDVIVLTIGSTVATVNGVRTVLKVEAPHIRSSTTYVPMRFLSESFGLVVDYSSAAKKVSISTGVTVELVQFAFQSETIRIKKGTTVTFINRDNVKHNAVANDGSFKTPLIGLNEKTSVKFDKAGEYRYYCEPHKSFMKGTIVVE